MTDRTGPAGDAPAPAMQPGRQPPLQEPSDPGPEPPLSERPCLNCGDPVHGNYCRMCGQRKAEHRVSVRRLLADALQDQFSLTSELPRTFKALAFHPGFLTSEYARGRIASYIPPFRVYLVTSILFFLLLSLDASGHNPVGGGGNFNFNISTDTTDTDGPPSADNPIALTPFEKLNTRLREKSALVAANPEEFGGRMKDYMIRRTPTMMFILLPVFALIMKLFYWRRYYAEHFIYSLHTHAFAFLIFTGLLLIPEAGIGDYIRKGLFLWLMIYPLIALRRVYAQGWPVTFVKYVVIGSLYLVVFSMAMYVQMVIMLLLL